MNSEDILDFWFKELTPKEHFEKNDALDQRISQRFKSIHKKVVAGETYEWRNTIQGRLAEIIILDQFSRNMFRGQKESFAYDCLALFLAQEAILHPELNELTTQEKSFIYMPFMHSESVLIHKQAEPLFAQPGLEDTNKFEQLHYDIIKRFGRYPHRNDILGQASTPEEIAFLKEPNSSF